MDNQKVLELILTKLDHLDKGQKSLQEELTGMKTAISDLQHETNGMKTAISDLQHETNGMKTAISDLQHETKEMKTAISDLQHETKEMKTTLGNLHQETYIGFKEINDKLDLLTKQTSYAIIEHHSNELSFLSEKVFSLEKELYILKKN